MQMINNKYLSEVNFDTAMDRYELKFVYDVVTVYVYVSADEHEGAKSDEHYFDSEDVIDDIARDVIKNYTATTLIFEKG